VPTTTPPSDPYREIAPPAPLAPFIECFWTGTGAGESRAVLPDGCIDIVFSARTGLRAVGTMTAPRHFTIPAGEQVTGVRFLPGAAPHYLGSTVAELTDQNPPLEEIWRAPRVRELADRLANAVSLAGRIHALVRALPEPGAKSLLERGIDAIVAAADGAALDTIAHRAGLSPRQFRRRVFDRTGVAPKHLSRILRFRRAQTLAARTPHPNWAGIAAECGYFDQAHLIRDFREFSGVTPAHDRFLQSPPLPVAV
jgi:AraC-like DNA-binding protein